jgi:lipid-A-disaccharide synthase-like uncharacterized protein
LPHEAPRGGRWPAGAATTLRAEAAAWWGDSGFWIGVGLLGNAAFALRFLVQWIASGARRSVVPVSFWYLSLVGAAILLCYAIHRRDPIFVLAYLPNGFIYAAQSLSPPPAGLTISSSTLPSGSRTHLAAALRPSRAPRRAPWGAPASSRSRRSRRRCS